MQIVDWRASDVRVSPSGTAFQNWHIRLEIMAMHCSLPWHWCNVERVACHLHASQAAFELYDLSLARHAKFGLLEIARGLSRLMSRNRRV